MCWKLMELCAIMGHGMLLKLMELCEIKYLTFNII